MTYGFEAVVPVEVGSPSLRRLDFDLQKNQEAMRVHLDMLSERRDMAQLKVDLYQGRIKRYFDKKVVPRKFEIGDLVLKKVTPADHTILGPNWEGPYKIAEVLGRETYKLMRLNEHDLLPRTYNVEHLLLYYRYGLNYSLG